MKLARTNTKTTQTSLYMEPWDSFAMTALAEERYGQRGLNKWLCNALETFVKSPGYVFKIGAGESHMHFSAKKMLTLSVDCQEVLETAVSGILRLNPHHSNLKSQLLRAAIRQGIDKSDPQGVAQLRKQFQAKIASEPGELIVSTRPAVRALRLPPKPRRTDDSLQTV